MQTDRQIELAQDIHSNHQLTMNLALKYCSEILNDHWNTLKIFELLTIELYVHRQIIKFLLCPMFTILHKISIDWI